MKPQKSPKYLTMTTTNSEPSRTIAGTLDDAQKALQRANVPEAKVCAEMLLGHVLHQRPTYLRVRSDRCVDAAEFAIFKNLLERRLSHEPVQYILGSQGFFGRTFEVGPGVLVPRPETEVLVEKTLAILEGVKRRPARVLDVGTGSGCVAITLALEVANVDVVACDVSREALRIAMRNAAKFEVAARCHMVLGESFWGQEKQEPFDVIVSNPPYIPTQAIATLQEQVKNFEPHLALDGGDDGLAVIRVLVSQAAKFLREEGFLLFEFGEDQVQAVVQLVEAAKVWKEVEVIFDLNQKPRVLKAKKWMQ